MRFGYLFFAYTDADGWHIGIGDPTLMGWLTVAAYFATSALCVYAAKTQRPVCRETLIFWMAVATITCLLGINKQLDLQTWLTLTMKNVAQAQGWYENRRIVQVLFIALVAVGAALGFRWAYRLVRGHARELWLALAGLFLILSFVVIRAASFHHVDLFLKSDIAGVRMNWLLELSAIAVLAAAAMKASAVGRKVDESQPSAIRASY